MEMKVRCDKQKLHLPITDYFSEMATSSSVNHGGRKQPHIRYRERD